MATKAQVVERSTTRYLSVKEAAEILRVSKPTIHLSSAKNPYAINL